MDKNRVIKHAIFWFIWMGSFTIIQSIGYGPDIYTAWAVYYLATLPLFMVHTYVIAYWLIPKYFFTHRYVVFSILIFVFLILASWCELILSNEFIWKWVNPENIQQGNYMAWSNVLINGIGNEYIIVVFLSVKVIRYWNSKMSEKTELQNQKLSTEIELLLYQSYPRFVLNVMDRLENMALNQLPQTSEMIIRLSNLMSHMTSIRTSDKILLQNEIEMIKSYIEIQRMIFQEGFDVNLVVSGELNNVQVPPFLFFQLVEEGFVVMSGDMEKSDFTIMIKSEQEYLLFSMILWNSDWIKIPFKQTVTENCRKYLNYFYPENHKFISNFEINFVELTIELYL